MKTEEMIRTVKSWFDLVDSEYGMDEGQEKDLEDIKIKIQQGEMWESFYKEYKHKPIRQGHYDNGIAKPSSSVGKLMDDFKQKYYKKEH